MFAYIYFKGTYTRNDIFEKTFIYEIDKLNTFEMYIYLKRTYMYELLTYIMI